MTPEEQRVKALELAIEASTGYSATNLAWWSDVLVETAGTFEKYIKGQENMREEPTPQDYETAERKWNEKHDLGFDELESFDQYILAGAAAKARKNGEKAMADFCPGCGHDTDHTREECPAS